MLSYLSKYVNAYGQKFKDFTGIVASYICMAQLSSFWTVNISKSAQSHPSSKLLSFLLVSVARNAVVGPTNEIRGYAEVERINLPSVRSQSLSRTFLCDHICRSWQWSDLAFVVQFSYADAYLGCVMRYGWGQWIYPLPEGSWSHTPLKVLLWLICNYRAEAIYPKLRVDNSQILSRQHGTASNRVYINISWGWFKTREHPNAMRCKGSLWYNLVDVQGSSTESCNSMWSFYREFAPRSDN